MSLLFPVFIFGIKTSHGLNYELSGNEDNLGVIESDVTGSPATISAQLNNSGELNIVQNYPANSVLFILPRQ